MYTNCFNCKQWFEGHLKQVSIMYLPQSATNLTPPMSNCLCMCVQSKIPPMRSSGGVLKLWSCS